jgi:hypothetical protein
MGNSESVCIDEVFETESVAGDGVDADAGAGAGANAGAGAGAGAVEVVETDVRENGANGVKGAGVGISTGTPCDTVEYVEIGLGGRALDRRYRGSGMERIGTPSGRRGTGGIDADADTRAASAVAAIASGEISKTISLFVLRELADFELFLRSAARGDGGPNEEDRGRRGKTVVYLSPVPALVLATSMPGRTAAPVPTNAEAEAEVANVSLAAGTELVPKVNPCLDSDVVLVDARPDALRARPPPTPPPTDSPPPSCVCAHLRARRRRRMMMKRMKRMRTTRKAITPAITPPMTPALGREEGRLTEEPELPVDVVVEL